LQVKIIILFLITGFCKKKVPSPGQKKVTCEQITFSINLIFNQNLLMSLFIRHGKPFAAFCPAGSQYPATILGGHTASVTVLVFSFPY
jgi:hypothetical protein